MSIDIHIINHNYIVRLVIFSVLLFKNLKGNIVSYESEVKKFLNKRIPDIDFKIYFFSDISLSDKRDMTIDRILNEDPRSDLTSLVVVNIKTSLKEVNIQLDLDNEEKYELFLKG